MKDINAIVAPMAWAGFVRIATEVWHKLELCKCRLPYLPGYNEPCPIGFEQLREIRRRELFNAWDGIGLGYIGPGR